MDYIDYTFRVDELRARREAAEVVARKSGSKSQGAYNGVDLVKNNTTGILGEMIFSEAFRLPRRLFSHPDCRDGDDGIDFRLSNGMTVDVKATCSTKPKLRVLETKSAPDIYVLASAPKADPEGRRLIGWAFGAQVRAAPDVATKLGTVKVLTVDFLAEMKSLKQIHAKGLKRCQIMSKLHSGTIFDVVIDDVNNCVYFDGQVMPIESLKEIEAKRANGASDEEVIEEAANWVAV